MIYAAKNSSAQEEAQKATASLPQLSKEGSVSSNLLSPSTSVTLSTTSSTSSTTSSTWETPSLTPVSSSSYPSTSLSLSAPATFASSPSLVKIQDNIIRGEASSNSASEDKYTVTVKRDSNPQSPFEDQEQIEKLTASFNSEELFRLFGIKKEGRATSPSPKDEQAKLTLLKRSEDDKYSYNSPTLLKDRFISKEPKPKPIAPIEHITPQGEDLKQGNKEEELMMTASALFVEKEQELKTLASSIPPSVLHSLPSNLVPDLKQPFVTQTNKPSLQSKH